MKRDEAILLHFQKAAQLTVSNKCYRDHLTELFTWMVKADGVDNDITSKTLSLAGKGKTQIVCKQEGIVAGLEEVKELLVNNTNLLFNSKVSDGTRVSKDQVIAEISGDNTEILVYERTILNILGRMSGIATETNLLIYSLKNDHPYIAAIRKTPLMMIDKKAVAIGGGLTHRLSLTDEILIKDNHLGMLQKELDLANSEKAAEEAVIKCMQSSRDYFEIEVDTLTQANAILHTFVKENAKLQKSKMMAILLDNFEAATAKSFVDSLRRLLVYESVLIEASGEITKMNLSDWSTTGVDVVSIGALTHSPKVFNFSMSY